jgi:hypothetical protein
MGITITPNVMHFLQVKEGARTRRSKKCKEAETKKKRNERKMEACRKDERQAHVDRAKKEGTYRKGMNMDGDGVDGYTAEDLQQKQPARKKRKTNNNVVCMHCRLTGHTTTRSRMCLKNKGNLATTGIPQQPAAVLSEHVRDEQEGDADDIEQLMLDAAADTDRMDSFPLVPDEDEEDEYGEFQDAGTWTDSEDDALPNGAI